MGFLGNGFIGGDGLKYKAKENISINAGGTTATLTTPTLKATDVLFIFDLVYGCQWSVGTHVTRSGQNGKVLTFDALPEALTFTVYIFE